MKPEKEPSQKTVREIEVEQTNLRKIRDLLRLADEEQIAFNEAMKLVEQGEAQIEIKEGPNKKELLIRLKKDSSVVFFNDFGEEEHAEEIERQLREGYN